MRKSSNLPDIFRSQKILKNLGLLSKKTFNGVLFRNCVVNGSRILISYTSWLLDFYMIAMARRRLDPTKWNSEFGLWLCLSAWISDQGALSDRIKHVWVIFKNPVFVFRENKTPCLCEMISTYLLCFFPSVVFMVNTYRFCWNLKTFRHYLSFTSLNLCHTRNLSSTEFCKSSYSMTGYYVYLLWQNISPNMLVDRIGLCMSNKLKIPHCFDFWYP